MKYIFVDIETKNRFLSGLDFNNPKGWLMSCFCIYNSYTGDKYYFVENKDEIISKYDEYTLSPVKKDILNNLYSFEDALKIMQSLYEGGYILTSFNGLNTYTHINFSLQNLIKGVIGDNYGKSMKSKNAPTQWAEGKYIEVLMYCMLDCIYISEVFNRLNIIDTEYIINYKRWGKVYECNIKNYEVVK